MGIQRYKIHILSFGLEFFRFYDMFVSRNRPIDVLLENSCSEGFKV